MKRLPDLPRHSWQLGITHPSEVAHRLEVDKVAFAGVQWAVPVAVVSVVVAHSEGTGLWQTTGGQLSRVVVRGASGLGLTMRHGQWETLLETQLSLHLLHSFLLNHHLVRAGRRTDIDLDLDSKLAY